MRESHQNPAPVGPAAPGMAAFAGNAEYSYADYHESELNTEKKVITRNWGGFLLPSSQSTLLAMGLQRCASSRMISNTPAWGRSLGAALLPTSQVFKRTPNPPQWSF